jgi:hypothetical protein
MSTHYYLAEIELNDSVRLVLKDMLNLSLPFPRPMLQTALLIQEVLKNSGI